MLRIPRRGERGYNMVILVIVITLMNAALAITLPAWSTAIRREKEEELIFRGLQYAEAIRVFRNRFQRLPQRLEELVEVKPRCIRQLWKDPMTESGKWQLIFEGQPTPLPLQAQPGNDLDEPESTEPGQLNGPRGTVAAGPIKGVRSSSGKEAILKFNNQQSYNQWEFTVDLLTPSAAVVPGAAVPGTTGGVVLSSRWIGRPLPRGLVPPGVNPNPNQNPNDPSLLNPPGTPLPPPTAPDPGGVPPQPLPPGQGIHPPLIPVPGTKPGGKPGGAA